MVAPHAGLVSAHIPDVNVWFSVFPGGKTDLFELPLERVDIACEFAHFSVFTVELEAQSSHSILEGVILGVW